MRLILLGIGAMDSPRYAPAGLLVEYGHVRVGLDGGPGSEPPDTADAWLVTDERSELRAELRRIAHEIGMPEPAVTTYEHGPLHIQPFAVRHTSHETYGYRITLGHRVAVWAPEFWEFPEWAERAQIMFADGAAWDRPIRFRGGVGGHMCVPDVAAAARRHQVRRLVFAHIDRPSLQALDAGELPTFGEWGEEGRRYSL